MRVSVVVVGVGEWERFTLPCIESIRHIEPGAQIVVVDNGSLYPPYEGAAFVRTPDIVSYAAALNRGMEAAPEGWCIATNNDVVFSFPFAEKVAKLDERALHGFYTRDALGKPFLSGWCYLISPTARRVVGRFDEAFAPMWYEDADYSWRAERAGLRLVEHDRREWGIYHFAADREGERAEYAGKYKAAMEANLEYLRRKHGL